MVDKAKQFTSFLVFCVILICGQKMYIKTKNAKTCYECLDFKL